MTPFHPGITVSGLSVAITALVASSANLSGPLTDLFGPDVAKRITAGIALLGVIGAVIAALGRSPGEKPPTPLPPVAPADKVTS